MVGTWNIFGPDIFFVSPTEDVTGKLWMARGGGWVGEGEGEGRGGEGGGGGGGGGGGWLLRRAGFRLRSRKVWRSVYQQVPTPATPTLQEYP